MLLVLALLVLVAAVALVRRHRIQLPVAVAAEGHRALRLARIHTGRYSLTIVMEQMVEQVLDSALPSLRTAYVPNSLTFGLHPEDLRRWGGYLDHLAEELRTLIVTEVERRSDLTLVGDLQLQLEENAAA